MIIFLGQHHFDVLFVVLATSTANFIIFQLMCCRLSRALHFLIISGDWASAPKRLGIRVPVPEELHQ